MSKNLNMNAEIIGAPIVREQKRPCAQLTQYLSERRGKNPSGNPFKSLFFAKALIEKGQRDPQIIISEIKKC